MEVLQLGLSDVFGLLMGNLPHGREACSLQEALRLGFCKGIIILLSEYSRWRF